MSMEFDENKMSDASVVYEDKNAKITPSMHLVFYRDILIVSSFYLLKLIIIYIIENIIAPHVKTSGSVPETKQHLPPIQNVIEKKSEINESQNRLPSLGNWLSTENRVSQPINNMGSMRMNHMTNYNITSESPSNLHNCLFSKDDRHRQNSMYYPQNMYTPMSNYGSSPVYLAIRPVNYGSLIPNSNMSNILYNGDNKLILKASSSQHIIQIPLTQYYQGQQQMGQSQYYQIPRNHYYGPR